MANESILPLQAFDGQVFIDAFRIKWVFDGSTQCWRKVGSVSDVPVASEIQTGLLSSKLKQLLDGIPEKGGHFGIVAQPLLSLIPQSPKLFKKDEVLQVRRVESGTRLIGKSTEQRPLNPDEFAGKILIFKTGSLAKKAFLIFTNDDQSIYLDGDATKAAAKDQYQIANSADLNPSGILLGDIMLVSDSIDITCVNGEGLPITKGACNLDIIQCDNVENPPGLNFQINQNFFDSLCITVPGCKGPAGARGDTGEDGQDGTGDGPVGEQGDLGEDAPIVANTFTGIKIIDIDDIHDTAVVSMELDAANGKLNVIRAKVRTPDSSSPATQIISTPINRSIRFTNSETFEYEIMKPSVDSIGVADVDILKYPSGFSVVNSAGSADKTTTVSKIKLSDLVNAITSFYENKLSEINDTYNQQLKTYVEAKDEAARNILADLAMQVSECEFEIPIEFCIGLQPNCNPDEKGVGYQNDTFVYPFTELLFGAATGATGTAIDMGFLNIQGVTADLKTVDKLTFIKYPNQEGDIDSRSDVSSVTLPAGGYVIQWLTGVLKSSATDYLVGSTDLNIGLEAIVTDGGDSPFIAKMPIPSAPFNDKENSSVEFAYSEAPLVEKVIAVELSSGGTIALRANLPGVSSQAGTNGTVQVRIIQVGL